MQSKAKPKRTLFAGRYPECERCGQLAEYCTPRDLCEPHWIDWWVGDDPSDPGENPLTPEERAKYRLEVEANLRNRYQIPLEAYRHGLFGED